ncbi:hypothetical protein [Xanthomonas theicola]|uniref:hypothetical protein n=1 Tax=Xanthomonas theicola TaxID=56464 RepID=UPI001304B214|nr:hypothetical protein [Xanthomonas theicola]QNH25513.1 hypothetical protein G4Q83_13195 [Xanthomonas theicola]
MKRWLQGITDGGNAWSAWRVRIAFGFAAIAAIPQACSAGIDGNAVRARRRAAAPPPAA